MRKGVGMEKFFPPPPPLACPSSSSGARNCRRRHYCLRCRPGWLTLGFDLLAVRHPLLQMFTVHLGPYTRDGVGSLGFPALSEGFENVDASTLKSLQTVQPEIARSPRGQVASPITLQPGEGTEQQRPLRLGRVRPIPGS